MKPGTPASLSRDKRDLSRQHLVVGFFHLFDGPGPQNGISEVRDPIGRLHAAAVRDIRWSFADITGPGPLSGGRKSSPVGRSRIQVVLRSRAKLGTAPVASAARAGKFAAPAASPVSRPAVSNDFDAALAIRDIKISVPYSCSRPIQKSGLSACGRGTTSY